MLKNQNPVMIAVPAAVRETFNQVAEARGLQQYEVVTQAAELMRRQQERAAKKGGVQK